MKFFASLLLLALAAIVAVSASPQPTAAPKIEKRQGFDPYNTAQYTNPAALGSLSSFLASQFGAISGMSLDPSYSSFISSGRAEANSYLSLASSIAANGGAKNSDLSSVLASLTATLTGNGQNNGMGNTGANSGQNNGQGNSGGSVASAASSAFSSATANAAMGTTFQLPAYIAGMVGCTFVAALAGAFVL